ncbi:MAG TPA: flagellar hook protein FlgE [Thiolapillus brandeum]|uniref:Flagellar hook protein FlgE n=1 Tax=Thiolapillus brandeum TaxID=1076588 RepID=A0A831RTX2_9GAMM|nr:flagellar hook protein FlgE [Thiolapillus brandeum]
MSFNTALSGIRAASGDLSIIGNNIANANTTGFKGSRAEFADVYAASLMGAPGTAIGQGVRLQGAAQHFGQGNISFTGNALDLAINGRGFFQLSDNGGASVYSRAGNFHLDRDGYIVNSEGLFLMARGADANGAITGGIGPMRIDTSYAQPNPTSALNANLNFDARESETDSSWALIGGVPDPAGYNSSTTTSVYDSQGNPHDITLYYSKQDPAANPNSWTVRTMIDGAVQDTTTVVFNDDGSYSSPASININWNPGGGATPGQAITVDLSKSTQYGSDFAVNSVYQDGFSTGQILGVDIDQEGMIFARYTNGQSRSIGQMVLANFANEQGLQPLGDTSWADTFASGPPVVGAPGTSGLGGIQSGALEESNVDLTEQLVKMIVAQRNFQANAQTIQTEDTVTQTIINLR